MRTYPWGGAYDSSRQAALIPAINNNFTNPGPEPVGRYPKGASPFGVEDLVGSVWQMTSEFQDDHNRAVILRGGSNYGPWRLEKQKGDHHCATIGVPGSTDPTTGANLSHWNCGSHW
jgi:formylglycine-generating enzyme required for sulfatase activity